MSVYIDKKYLALISIRLRNYKQKSEDLFNFSCPYCGDSQKKPSKARGYVFRKNNDYFYMCHNCNVSTTFGKFLEFMNTQMYKEYRVERFADNNPSPITNVKIEDLKPLYKIKTLSDFRNTVYALPDGHFAKEYIRNRKIPEQFWSEIFFVDNYSGWMNTNFPDHGKKDLPQDPRIVLFYTNKNKEITQVTGRALTAENKLRYVTVKILENERKVFGLHRMVPEKRVYVVEGQFDSMFLENAVASGDANLMSLAEYLYKTCFCEDIVLLYDNTPRNKELVPMIENSIRNGFKVSLLPYDPLAKDINEMIKHGMSMNDIQKLIDDHVYQGLSAQLEFSKWRKC